MEDLFITENITTQDEVRNDTSDANEVLLHNRFSVALNTPLQNLDKGGKAFAVHDKQEQYLNLYAYVADPELLPRTDISETIFRRSIELMQKIYGWSINYWPPYQRRVPIFLMEIPNGRSLAEILKDQTVQFDEDLLLRILIRPCVKLLMNFKDINITHRNLRADNIFWDENPDSEVVFGECFSTAAGYMQPIQSENISRMQASPFLRGAGNQSLDIFALGVLIVELLSKGSPPWLGMSNETIIEKRLELGSYQFYSQKLNYTPSMGEFMRGILYETNIDRWDINQIYNWTHGKRLSPRNPFSVKKARKQIKINNVNCLTTRDVCYHLVKDWDKGMEICNNGLLENWLRNDLGDQATLERYTTAYYSQSQIKDPSTKFTLCLMALEHRNPIFLKKWAMAVDALPQLFLLVIESENYDEFHHFITSDILSIWADYNENDTSSKRLISNFSSAFQYMAREAVGYGKERVLYQISKNMIFRGNLSKTDYIPEIWYLLPALDRAFGAGYKPDTLLDSHIIAYLCANYSRNLDEDMRKLSLLRNSIENVRIPSALKSLKARIVVAEAKIFAEVQIKTNNGFELPNLCNYFIDRLGDAVNLFHSRAMQRQVRRDLKELGRRGILMEVLDLIADNKRIEIDQKGFEDACKRYEKIINDLNEVRTQIHNRKKLSEETGGRYAVTISSVFSFVATIVIFVLNIV